MNEKDIQKILMKWLLDKKHIFVLPNNKSVFSWEADMLSVTGSGMIHEYEIKTSLRDYEQDFSGSRKKQVKHDILANFPHRAPNRFWFCTYGFELESWVPFYAGVIRVESNGNIQELKKAPLLHNTTASMPQIKRMMRSVSFRLLSHYYKNTSNGVKRIQ